MGDHAQRKQVQVHRTSEAPGSPHRGECKEARPFGKTSRPDRICDREQARRRRQEGWQWPRQEAQYGVEPRRWPRQPCEIAGWLARRPRAGRTGLAPQLAAAGPRGRQLASDAMAGHRSRTSAGPSGPGRLLALGVTSPHAMQRLASAGVRRRNIDIDRHQPRPRTGLDHVGLALVDQHERARP